MATKRRRVRGTTVRVHNLYEILRERIEGEIGYYVRHKFKHDQKPPLDGVLERAIEAAVEGAMTGVCEVLDLGDSYG
jgi:hypothetical protein